MKRFLVFLSVLLVLTSCAPTREKTDVDENEDKVTVDDKSIIPNHKISEDEYKIMLPYRPSEARGTITNQISNRLDIDQMEEGLRRHSVKTFDPDSFFFEEGQYLTSDFIIETIEKNNPKRDKLKTKADHEKNPRIFSHVLEQNYLTKTKDDKVKLGGISLGISLKSIYRFRVEEGGPFYETNISNQAAIKRGEEIAEALVKELRNKEGLEEVPIMIALYQEQSISSQVPGNFIKQTVVEKGSSVINNWQNISEKFVLFPSEEGKKNHIDDFEKVVKFGKGVGEYFPNYVGVIGEGLYIDNELETMSLNIPIEFYGKSEILGFTQYVYGLAKEVFPKHYNLEIKISSVDQVESLLYREAGSDELNVHILH